MALQRDHQNTHGSLTWLSVFQEPEHPSSLRLVKTKNEDLCLDLSMANSIYDFERISASAECKRLRANSIQDWKASSMRKGMPYLPGLQSNQAIVWFLMHNIHTNRDLSLTTLNKKYRTNASQLLLKPKTHHPPIVQSQPFRLLRCLLGRFSAR